MARNKVYSLINITGLAIGMATSMLIFLWVVDELAMDRYHERGDQIHRVLLKLYREDKVQKVALTPPALSVAFKNDLDVVKDGCRYYHEAAGLVRSGLYTDDEEWFTYADPSIFRMFTFNFIAGDKLSALDHPHSVVISERIAAKYFPGTDAIGRFLMIKNGLNVKVSGVIKNEDHTHLIHDIILPFILLEEFGRDINSWNFIDYCNYVELEKGVEIEEAEDVINTYLIDEIGAKRSFVFLQPLKKMHLYSDFDYEYIKAGDIQILYTTSLLALFILIIACINFMNLSTARAYQRFREVGWRKVAGATKRQITFQFLGESVLLALFAFIISMVILEIFIGRFNLLVDKNIELYKQGPLMVVSGFSIIIIITGLLSGTYPAFYLSRINPTDILKKTLHKGKHGVFFRKVLVIFQFTISIFLIIVTWVIWQQLNYIRKQNLGYDRSDMITMQINEEIREDYEAFRESIAEKKGVLNVTTAFMPPIWDGPQTTIYDWEGNIDKERKRFYYQMIDLDFIETFRIKLVEGEEFGKEHLENPMAYYILNEEAVRQMNIKEPTGKIVQIFDEGKIIGVVEDFNFHTIHKEIEPLILALKPSEARYMFIRLNSEDYERNIIEIEQAWNDLNNNYPYEYQDYNELVYESYDSEDKTGTMLRYFTLLAILISCMGLYGLSLFMSGTRTKEIGIRKTLGASTDDLIRMILTEFFRWIAWATIISWPLAYFALHNWLGHFAYHVEINPLIFVASGLIALIIGLGTTLLQSLKSARANPAMTIRYE